MVEVSVIIPCYNRAALLAETLESVRAQTFSRWEAIVVDDHSQDDSLAVARKFAAADERIIALLRQDARKGGNVCRNEGFARARGRYAVFLDSDNLLAPTCLAGRVTAMDRDPERVFGAFQTEIFDEQIGDRARLCNQFNDADDLLRLLSFDAVWHTGGPIWRRDWLASLGAFDPELPSFQEWELHVRALAARPRYFKAAVRDHYYRLGARKGDRVGHHAITDPVHLKSHERMFRRTVARLRAAGLVDEPVRRRLAGIFWWLATRYRLVISPAEAARIWRETHELKLIPRSHLLEGLVQIQTARIKGGRHVGRLFQLSWPCEYRAWFSPTMNNTPVESLDDRIIPVN